MANELRVTADRLYIERDTPALIVSSARVYVELVSTEIRVSATQLYIERSQPKLSVSGAAVYVENRKNENTFILQINGVQLTNIKNFKYVISVKTIDTITLASTSFTQIPNYSDTSISMDGSWYQELNSLISLGSVLSSCAIQVVDRYGVELQLSLSNSFVVEYTVENSIDSEILFNISIVGENDG